jgi:peroxiredoxin
MTCYPVSSLCVLLCAGRLFEQARLRFRLRIVRINELIFMKQVIPIMALVCAATVAFGSAEIGKPAPDFKARDINGKTHKLSDYKGKIVVLESYNYDCPFCANHFKTGAMQELQADLAKKGIVWLMINSVNPNHASYRKPEAAQKEWKEQKLQATAWLDDNSGTIGKAYGMTTTPHMFVIDKDGNLAYNGAIDDAPEDEGDPRKARNYVKEAVGKLLAGQKVEVTKTKPYGCGVKY